MPSYGWKPDLPDARDYPYKAVRPTAAKLPTKVDLRPSASPIEDQGSLGSCTANALAGAMEFLMVKGGQPYTDLSRLFVYYYERQMEGTVAYDSGAQLRTGIKVLAKQGACAESLWPYRTGKFQDKPPAACSKDAADRQITGYFRLSTLSDMRTCLADGYPFVFGFTVYDAFESAQVAKSGVLNLPKKGEAVVGGHAVLAVGYDDAKKRLLVRNSWGTGWGQKGHFTMPYAYASNTNLADDFWTIRSEEIGPAKMKKAQKGMG
jgi:C1A family cysteine protease